MKRYTVKKDGVYSCLEGVAEEEILQRLGKFEDMIEAISLEQVQLREEIEKYHDGNTRKIHWRAKEAGGKKMVNAAVLLKLKQHGMEIDEND